MQEYDIPLEGEPEVRLLGPNENVLLMPYDTPEYFGQLPRVTPHVLPVQCTMNPEHGPDGTYSVPVPAAAHWLVNELGAPVCPIVALSPTYSYDPNNSDLHPDCRVVQYLYNLGIHSFWQQQTNTPHAPTLSVFECPKKRYINSMYYDYIPPEPSHAVPASVPPQSFTEPRVHQPPPPYQCCTGTEGQIDEHQPDREEPGSPETRASPDSPVGECSSSPSSLLDSIEKGIRSKYCPFCKSNGETALVYRSHDLKEEDGRVVCPILWAYTCPICGATRNHAHTPKYCPQAEEPRCLLPGRPSWWSAK